MFNCLKINRQSFDRTSRGCQKCNYKYNTLLNIDNYNSKSSRGEKGDSFTNEQENLMTSQMSVPINADKLINESSVNYA